MVSLIEEENRNENDFGIGTVVFDDVTKSVQMKSKQLLQEAVIKIYMFSIDPTLIQFTK